ncbi:MAG TPA: hypothetical protein DIW17_17130 [Clostridiales bacterium]|jgi:hypothetical protein|nr:hypothetical protein [Clostridiales bacterium]
MPEFGCYDANGLAKIEINNNKTIQDFNYTMIHEIIHKILTESTNYGYVIFLLKQIIQSDDSSKALIEQLSKVYNILMKNMLKLQEGTAGFLELTYIKAQSPGDYADRYASYKRDTNYNNNIFKRLDKIFKDDSMETIVPLTIGLAEIALNIDLNDLNINQKHLEQTMTSNEKTVLLINLNVRFKTSIQQKKLISKNWLKQAASNMQNHLFKILLLEQRKI